METKQKLHTIMLVEINGDCTIYEKNIISCKRRGLTITLERQTGSKADYDLHEWEMFDVTPVPGWNTHI